MKRLFRWLRRWLDREDFDWKKITRMKSEEREAWDDYCFSYYVSYNEFPDKRHKFKGG
jgi:hypothetical protein